MGCFSLITAFLAALGFSIFGLVATPQDMTMPEAMGVDEAPTVAIESASDSSTFIVVQDGSRYAGITQSYTEDGAFVIGDPAATVTIVAFEDFLCPHCQDFTEEVVNDFMDEYVLTGRARFEYRFWPVVDPTYSVMAAQIAECTDEISPGAFWRAHDVMYELVSEAGFNDMIAEEFAIRMDMDYNALLMCAADANQHEVDTLLARDFGATGTPTLGFRLDGGDLLNLPTGPRPTLQQLRALIDQFE